MLIGFNTSQPTDTERDIMVERRRFSRIIYQAPAVINQGEYELQTTIQDLSLHGLLLSAEQVPDLVVHSSVNVSFTLPESDITIHLQAEVLSTQNDIVRLKIDNIDIDSISHLKRLVELNVGNDRLLHREIEHLSDLGKEI